jgi:hypothetical protein
MSPRRAIELGALLASLLPARGQAQASDYCDLDGWLGTQVELRPGKLPGDFGWEAGFLPLGKAVFHDKCLRIGPGVKLTYADGFHTALVARLSLGDPSGFSERQIYLQGGPVLDDKAVGFDVEAGLDWGFAAVFVAANRFDGRGGSLGSALTIGVRFSFATVAAFFTLMALHPPT